MKFFHISDLHFITLRCYVHSFGLAVGQDLFFANGKFSRFTARYNLSSRNL